MKSLKGIRSCIKETGHRLPGCLVLLITIFLLSLLSNPAIISSSPGKEHNLRKPFISPLYGDVALGFREEYFNDEKQADYKHTGIDIIGDPGDSISASGNGIIAYTGFSPIGGRTIVIRHNQDIRTTYLNLQNIYVSQGDMVKQGDNIATIGAYDDPSFIDSHLHFAIIYLNKYLDPLQVLNMDYNSISRFLRLVYVPGDLKIY
ncbi:MAG: M23 family metallopeptidase [Candidatus Humimicrobiaceae bacterium]